MRLYTQSIAQTTLAFMVMMLWVPVAAQIATPTNTTAPQNQTATDIVIFQVGTVPNVSQRLLKPLTGAASLNTTDNGPSLHLTGLLTAVDTSNYNTVVVNHTITLLSCDPASYSGGFLTVTNVFTQLYSRGPSAIILYSTSSTDSGCIFNIPGDSGYNAGMVFTTTSQMDVSVLLQSNSINSNQKTTFMISQRGSVDAGSGNNSTTQSQSGNNNNGPLNSTSPSTAVAMIILYSITGVITALFLVIIVTGAIRAHRHPERYGPRTGLGRRSGQSRARGLARAMLDTIPIVKFGEKDEDKEEEGGAASGTRDVEMAGGVLERAAGAEEDKTEDEDDESQEHNSEQHQNKTEGTEAGVTGASGDVDAIAASREPKGKERSSTSEKLEQHVSPTPTPLPVENLGCSICTEDFERGQDVRILPCNHQFHPACIDPWLLNVSGTCPLCRIDLRPNAEQAGSPRSSVSLPENHDFPPPIDPDGDGTTSAAPVRHLYPSANPVRRSSRRGSSIMADIRDILNPRAMREASTQERIAALRVVRERGTEEDARRRRRMSARLQDVFSVRTLRGRSPVPPTEASSSTDGAAGRRGSTIGRGTSVRDSVAEVPEPTEEASSSTIPVPEMRVSQPVEVSDPIVEAELEAEHHSKGPEASSSVAESSKKQEEQGKKSSS